MGRANRSRLTTRAVLLPLSIALSIVFALVAVLPDQFRTLHCRYTGLVMDEVACCPSVGQPGAPREVWRGEACCLVRSVELARLASEREREDANHRLSQRRPESGGASHLAPAAGALMTAPALLARAAPSRDARSLALARPRVGPPLLLLKQSFLI